MAALREAEVVKPTFTAPHRYTLTPPHRRGTHRYAVPAAKAGLCAVALGGRCAGNDADRSPYVEQYHTVRPSYSLQLAIRAYTCKQKLACVCVFVSLCLL